MIRLIVKIFMLSPDGYHGGTEYRTFDIEHSDLEKLLLSSNNITSLAGAEVLPKGEQ